MPLQELINTKGSVVREESIQQFRTKFQGDLVRPGEDAYERARQIWNVSVEKRPGMIARCSGVADVVAAVNFAGENELLVAVRGGGHNVGGRALCEGGLVIDLSRMKGIHVDPVKRTARVQGGATLADVDRETHLFGLAVPAGVVSRTGIAGLTLGGGVGWLMRRFGMTIDNVLSFETVTADGKVLTASAHENADLFWGLRGGGGNFGVVTSFEFQAHPVRTVLSGLLVHPLAAAAEVLRFFREFMRSAPDELTAYTALLHTPDGMAVAGVIPCYCGELSEGERVLKRLREFGPPVLDTIQPMPFPAVQSMLDAFFPDGNHNYWKSSMHQELNDEAIAAIADHAKAMSSPLSMIVVERYGGAAGRVGASETAFPHRQALWDIIIGAQWTNSAESPQHRAWARSAADALRPFSLGAYLLSALDQETDEIINAAFGTNLPRLAAIKKKYDPGNFFRVNQNIRPA
jgi:FAD binding domain/Berberine and berberine like